MEDEIKKVIENYQCPGCVCGSDIGCFESSDNLECGKHVAGTTIFPAVGRIYLGMPTGFNRVSENMKINIFQSPAKGWGFGQYGYGKYNVAVWKYLDEHGNTIVRGLSPRINSLFLHVFIGDHMDDITCLEITNADINEMD